MSIGDGDTGAISPIHCCCWEIRFKLLKTHRALDVEDAFLPLWPICLKVKSLRKEYGHLECLDTNILLSWTRKRVNGVREEVLIVYDLNKILKHGLSSLLLIFISMPIYASFLSFSVTSTSNDYFALKTLLSNEPFICSRVSEIPCTWTLDDSACNNALRFGSAKTLLFSRELYVLSLHDWKYEV